MAGGREDRRVHPDQPARGIEQRAAGIARIDRRIGLDHPGEFPPLPRRQAPLQRADHAGGQRVVEAEGVADGEGRLANLQVRRGADGEGRRHAADAAELEHREVVGGRGADEARGHHLARGEPHRDGAAGLGGRLDDVVVGDDVPGGVPDEAGAGLGVAALALLLLLVVEAHQGLPPRCPLREDVDHRGARPLEQRDGAGLRGREVAARRHRPRRLGREQERREIGLGDEQREQDQHRDQGHPHKTIRHGRPDPPAPVETEHCGHSPAPASGARVALNWSFSLVPSTRRRPGRKRDESVRQHTTQPRWTG
ncbi:hypothetical protein MET9862_05722 [Methylobacterium symbioticum]|uniref:Uncharacterized protein n=1 Tax=Methylobacterium symbioticum TaxID=2584084 RepID=A0A509EM81_9HYPH|nr:hypothetical protein MET9862_05722 [Methylobacterium symbioticum]